MRLDDLIELSTSSDARRRAAVVPTLARTESEAMILPPPQGDSRWRSAWGAQISHHLPSFSWSRRRMAWISPSVECLVDAHRFLHLFIGHDPPMSDGAMAYIYRETNS